MNTPFSPANLLQSDWTEDALRDVFARHPRRPLLPPMESGAWTRVRANPLACELILPVRGRADAEAVQPLPELSDELYGSFSETGIRLTFENQYFERRRRLARAAVSLLVCAENDPGRAVLVSSVVTKFQDIFEEVSWALPAHVNWSNDDRSGKDPLQIDLFCAETANLMAEMLDVFGSLLPASLQERVRVKLQRNIFENFLQRDFHWREVTHNWNAVCHQGVLGAALSQVDDPLLLARMFGRAKAGLPLFLSGFGPDGGCSEGPAYWGYGFGWFAMLNEQLEKRTGGELSLFEGDSHLRAIALYGPRMLLANGHVVNFADGPASGGMDPARLSYLGERLDLRDCRLAAQENYRRLLREGMPWDIERADFFHFSRWLLRCPAELPEVVDSPEDCFLPDLAVLVGRGKDEAGCVWEFAAKAGHNAEHHNHNDCGSYLVNVNGQRLISEIGAPEYVHDFFLPEKRYDFLAARSRGHSVPLVNGWEQHAGAEFAARVLACEFDSSRVAFSVDLTACYPKEAQCRSLVRTFHWSKREGWITVEDAFELEEPGRLESVVICEAPVEAGQDAVMIKGGNLSLCVAPLEGTRFLAREVCAYRGKLGDDRSVNRLVFGLPEPVRSGKAQYRITLPAS